MTVVSLSEFLTGCSMLPKAVQIVLFSATFPDAVVRYANKFAPGANQITLKHEELTVEGIKQLYLDCNSEQDKYDVLVKLYGLMTIGSSIIFVKACHLRLYRLLCDRYANFTSVVILQQRSSVV